MGITMLLGWLVCFVVWFVCLCCCVTWVILIVGFLCCFVALFGFCCGLGFVLCVGWGVFSLNIGLVVGLFGFGY